MSTLVGMCGTWVTDRGLEVAVEILVTREEPGQATRYLVVPVACRSTPWIWVSDHEVTDLAHPIVPVWPAPTGARLRTPEDPLAIVARFLGQSRGDRKLAETTAYNFYVTAAGNEAATIWLEAAQRHPSFERIQLDVWQALPRRWQGSAVAQLIVDVLCAPAIALPADIDFELAFAMRVIRNDFG